MEKPINFESFSDMDHGQLFGENVNLNYIAAASMILGALFLFMGISVMSAGHGNGFSTVSGALVLILGLAGLIWGFILLHRLKKQEEAAWLSFATANGWQQLDKATTMTLVPPSVTNIGHSIKSGPGVEGTFLGLTFVLFTYSFITGSGKSQVQHDKLIFGSNLNHDLPEILLVHKKHLQESIIDISDPINKPPDKEKIDLEGDFGDYFDVFGQTGNDVQIREVLTPDVMQQLILLHTNCNLEFSGQRLYFITDGYESSVAKIKSIFGLTQPVISLLAKNYSLSHVQPLVAPVADRPISAGDIGRE